MGYLQCFYELNRSVLHYRGLVLSLQNIPVHTRNLQSMSGHIRSPAMLTLTLRLYKTVFPSGLDSYATPATSKFPSPSPSIRSETSSTNTATSKQRSGFFGRWGASGLSAQAPANPVIGSPDGPVEELIMSGTAFGACRFDNVPQNVLMSWTIRLRVCCCCCYLGASSCLRACSLFNLVFSLLPANIRSVAHFPVSATPDRLFQRRRRLPRVQA